MVGWVGGLPAIVRRPGDHPRVLAAAALRRIDDQGAFAQRHAGESPGQYVDVLAVEHIRAKIEVTTLEMVVHQYRRTRQRQGRLGDVLARLGADAAGELLALGAVGMR